MTARWAAVTTALCAVHLLLATAIPDASMHMGGASTAIKLGLLSQEFIALGVLALLPSIPGPWYARVVFSLITVVIIAGGWITFLATGRFPGVEGIRFFLVVPEQAFEHLLHLRASLLYAVPVIVLVGTGLLTQLSVWAGREWAKPQTKLLVFIGAGIVGTSLVWHGVTGITLAADDSELYDVRTGVSYRADLFWETARERRAGPASALFRSIAVEVRTPHVASVADPGVVVVRPHRAAGELIRSGAPAHRWNVLVLEVESMRSDVLRAWGSPVDVMPTVDDIARHGRRFLDTYTTATQTNLAAVVPVSGQYPLRTRGPRPYPSRTSYPKLLLYDLLAQRGWRSAIFSSQNESWWGMANFLRSASLDTLFNAENFRGHTLVAGQDLAFADFVTRAKRSGKIDDHDTAHEAIRWINADSSRPFFVYMNFQSSHIPYTTPATFARRFGSPPSFPVMFGRYPPESAEVVRNQYRNALAYIDDQVALVRAALIADGRWDSTIVVITGDHGQAFFEHGVAAHANGLWQELVRVPLVIKAPGMSPFDDRRAASHVDIAPTIAAVLGFPPQPVWQGISLVDSAGRADRPRFFMVQSPLAEETGVVSGKWKMVRNTLVGSTRLTDLTADPQERVDASAKYPTVAAQMRGLLNTWSAMQLEYYGSLVLPTVSFPPRITLPPVH